ncbi:MAG: inositol monophosphatase, partial [Chloroflexi bacterium]|nr:inositol monophosphatase [Chloroflexota bacterium]
TDTDIAAQQLITDAIRARFPDHGFLTEEEDGNLPVDGPVIWVIDPVDGTTNFSRAIPTFCVSIAAVSPDDEVLAGAIYDPMRDELFSAAKGQGATLNGRPIHVSPIDKLGDAVIAVDWSHSEKLRQSVLDILHQFAHKVNTVRAIGAAALALAWIGAGRVDGYVNFQLKPWDMAAASLIISEAGGQLSELSGQRWGYSPNASGCVAGNGRIHLKINNH